MKLTKEEFLFLVDYLEGKDEYRFAEFEKGFSFDEIQISQWEIDNARNYAVEKLKQLIEEHFSSSIRVGTRGQCKSCESKFLKGISDAEKQVDKYRIALDKACEKLEMMVDESEWFNLSKDGWKEYLLNEDN